MTTSDFTVTLLGTGTPIPRLDRFGISTLVRAGSQTLIFDCGRGVTQRLFQLDGSLRNSGTLFLTHLHSDHVVGIPDLWLTGALFAIGNRPTSLNAYGPQGTADMMLHMQKTFAVDVNARIRSSAGGDLTALQANGTDIETGEVYNKEGVVVTAFLVEHKIIEPAFGYRVDYDGRSVVISGDTVYSENLIKHSEGADLLIHEVVVVPEGEEVSAMVKQVQSIHTSPEEVGNIFDQVRPKLGVYSHIVQFLGATDDDLVKGTRKTYDGAFKVGQDMDTFEISDEVRLVTL